MANRARDWSAPRQIPAPHSTNPDPGRCDEHNIPLLENGSEGRYLCPQCLQHQWEEMHESEFAWSFAYVLPRLYGRQHRPTRQTPEDLRPWTVWTYQRLRTRARKYAKEVLRIRGANQMDLEPLLPFIGRTPAEQWDRLQRLERRGSRKSP